MRLISRKGLDEQKYLDCLERDGNARIYALPVFLDAVSDAWQVLVLGDYDAVMPFPVRRTSGVSYVYQPMWCQQLGLYGEQQDIEEILKYAGRKFIRFDYCMHGEHSFGTKRNNLFLPLDLAATELQAGYNKNRQRNIQKAISTGLKIKRLEESNALLDFALLNTTYLRYEKQFVKKIKNLIDTLPSEMIYCLQVEHENQTIAGLFGLKDHQRIYLLHPFLHPDYKDLAQKLGAMSFLIDYIITKHENSSSILDFEGSMIEGVARFYMSFGAQIEHYTHVKKSLFGMING